MGCYCVLCSADFQGYPLIHSPNQASGQPQDTSSRQQVAAISGSNQQLERVQVPAGSQGQTEAQQNNRGDMQQGRCIGSHPGMQAQQLHHKQGIRGSTAGEQPLISTKAVPSQGVLPRVTVTRGPACPQ